MRTRIKICGITSEQDALDAARCGVDAIGLVFYPPSPRFVSLGQALAIRKALPPFVATVALFMDADAEEVIEISERLQPDLLQFHGAEEPDYCAAFGRSFIKAVPMGSDGAADYANRFEAAVGLLVDSHAAGQAGGSGEAFDWSALPEGLGRPLVLAGGLHPGNVADAIRQIRPWAVDVSSGVEASKGVKDAAKMSAFVHETRKVDDDNTGR